MNQAVFFRLLEDENKERSLAAAIALVETSGHDSSTYIIDPHLFKEIAGSPFAYWVSDSIIKLFKELPFFESEDRAVRVGLGTCDDFRFLRTWWEVPSSNILEASDTPVQKEYRDVFQAWCRNETFNNKRWCLFAKGGPFSPYYADVYMLVNWENDGAEIRSFRDPKTNKLFSRPQNIGFYFLPGMFQTLRANHLAPHLTPSGCIFGHNGFQAFSSQEDIIKWLAVLNSSTMEFLYKMQLGRYGYALYVPGTLQKTPAPKYLSAELSDIAYKCLIKKQIIDLTNEISHLFFLPAVLSFEGKNLVIQNK